ncbi:MAG: hypothetical protein ABI778_08390 [Ignavibacteriota bacterium]
MIRSFIAALLILGSSFVSIAHAQDSPDALNIRASRLIDSTMASVNIRAERFNEELTRVNAIKPLDAASLTKEVIPGNMEKVKDFLSYLDLYRSLCAKQRQEVVDSATALKSKMPSRYKETFLKEFIDAYDLDQSSFIKYTQALTKVYTNINLALAFVEQSHVTVKDNKLQFSDKKEYEEYSALITNIEKSNKKVINASATSQRATIDASAMMQKAYGEIK